MLGEFFFCAVSIELYFAASFEAAFSVFVTYRVVPVLEVSRGHFKTIIVYAGILCEQEFIAGMINLWKICIFVVYLYRNY